MSRYQIIAAAFVGALLVLLPLHPADAQTSKSSSKKKSSATTKKKPSASTAKKKTATEEKTKMGTESADTKTGTTPTLDLPLPAKVAPPTEGGTSAEKKAAENGAAASKAAENPTPDATTKSERAPNATVEPEAIAEFSSQPLKIQQLIRDAIDLTRLNLTYTFGSADPDKGGMDCSGTIYYLLRAHGFEDVARDSSGQYLWARKRATFFPVVSKNAESVEFEELQPGDLMFWTGTYQTERDVPISHVMLYLGREKGTNKRIMFGASDGRSYNGIQRWGVSVFDFKMPRPDAANPEKAKVDFVGFARIPGLRSPSTLPPQVAAVTAAQEPKKPASKPSVKSSSKKKGATRKSQ